MPTILSAAASGMMHNQSVLDVVGNNLANVNTAGFKRTRALHQGAPVPAIPPEGGRLGVAETTTDRVFLGGAPQHTDDPLHFAITDDSFFAVRDFDGAVVYSRFGGLSVDADGNVVAFGGRFLEPPVTLPAGYREPAIDQTGRITALDEAGERQEVGRLTLSRFANPQGLVQLGDGLYGETVNSGARTEGVPGADGFAAIVPGAVEGSNVDMAEEFTTMIIAQRAYQASLKSFQVGDEMLALATNLTR
ncbi:MAG: flagellar hook-basal body protein [Dehalococcoidia bacterium]|nr:flagellar hook-basal body protein [Dehalococcoidia bacterium]